MLTENRKRRRGGDIEGDQLNPQVKRSGGGQEAQALVSNLGQDVWDSESSSSDSSSRISSPERAAIGADTSMCTQSQKNCTSQGLLRASPDHPSISSLSLYSDSTSYDHINRLLRGQPGAS
ncbi:hypothetical protein UPYG_G00135530 [Umbra pygmaea]|uniref:Uncharacterized protein n=1 Tax=Umbra pygmaea TaxID=75934 RepID=A0ABD0WU43_UMBPY